MSAYGVKPLPLNFDIRDLVSINVRSKIKPNDPHSHEMSTLPTRFNEPENLLWVRVIEQALIDATVNSSINPKGKRRSKHEASVLRSRSLQAQAWVFSTAGCSTHEKFRMVCDFASIDPDVIRRATKFLLENNIPFSGFSRNEDEDDSDDQ